MHLPRSMVHRLRRASTRSRHCALSWGTFFYEAWAECTRPMALTWYQHPLNIPAIHLLLLFIAKSVFLTTRSLSHHSHPDLPIVSFLRPFKATTPTFATAVVRSSQAVLSQALNTAVIRIILHVCVCSAFSTAFPGIALSGLAVRNAHFRVRQLPSAVGRVLLAPCAFLDVIAVFRGTMALVLGSWGARLGIRRPLHVTALVLAAPGSWVFPTVCSTAPLGAPNPLASRTAIPETRKPLSGIVIAAAAITIYFTASTAPIRAGPFHLASWAAWLAFQRRRLAVGSVVVCAIEDPAR